MQDTQLIHEGLALMGLGMGFVFVFLTVLVGVTTLMSKTIGRFFPEPAAPIPAVGSRAPASRQDDDLTVVISAAVHRYRRRHRR
ncbi:sodium pump decarboxylase subunit gamma [Halomonas aestuarii]|uniref:Probable oxaloacetate decarboxylase gamma chain n=1 Tax=Halomonas aestuarii TaxID=1897729 RepID=A0A1J0VH11_9GAMM|nr:OadG family transporter subunit [Halomonas aestuarii]APE31302.1 sodium pump decarboxylase subunit gamma [Halomonas aestuarii]